MKTKLSDKGGSGSGLVLECRRELLLLDVVSGQSVDSGLNKNHSELGILVTTVSLEVLSDRDGLLDEVVEVLGDGWGEAVGLQDPEDLVSGNEFDLRDTVRVSEDDTDLRRRKTSPGELEDLVRDLLGGGLGPRWLRTSEW